MLYSKRITRTYPKHIKERLLLKRTELLILTCLLIIIPSCMIAENGILDAPWLQEYPEERRERAFINDVIANVTHYTEIRSPGIYSTSQDFVPGLYTFFVEEGESSSFSIAKNDGSFSREYAPEGPAEYSFYIPADTTVTLNEGCILTTLNAEWEFQLQQNYKIKNMRFLINFQVPACEYTISGISGAESYYTLTSVKYDAGENAPPINIPLNEGESITVRFSFDEYRFIEFVNCIVTPSETVG